MHLKLTMNKIIINWRTVQNQPTLTIVNGNAGLAAGPLVLYIVNKAARGFRLILLKLVPFQFSIKLLEVIDAIRSYIFAVF